MAQMHRPYSLHKRQTSKGKDVYYVQFWNADLHVYDSAKSSGKSTKSAAANWADNEIAEGRALISRKTYFRDFAKDFYDWNTSEWVKMKRMSEGIHQLHVQNLKYNFDKHVYPTFKDKNLLEITTPAVEGFLGDLYDRGYAKTTIRHIYQCLRHVLEEATRQKLIPENPCARARKPTKKKRSTPKGILDFAEVKKLLDESTIEQVWGKGRDSILHYTFNLVAAGTGLRTNEIQGLRIESIDLAKRVATIDKVWEREYGLKEGPKTDGSYRQVPLSKTMVKYIKKLVPALDATPKKTFIFEGRIADQPIGHTAVGDHFRAAIERIGIKDRKERNITFHSYRHFFNTYLISRGMPDYSVMKVVGHTDADTSFNYYHLDDQTVKRVRMLQEEIA